MSKMDNSGASFTPMETSQHSDGHKTKQNLIVFFTAGAFILALIAAIYSIKAVNDKPNVIDPQAGIIPNMDSQKKVLRDYYVTSNQYQYELFQLTNTWTEYFSRLTPNPNGRDVVIFDIDDTLLSNLRNILDTDFGHIPKLFDDWVLNATAPAINQTRTLLKYLKGRGFNVIAITGRPYTQEDATRVNFLRWDIDPSIFSALIFRSAAEPSSTMTATTYKSTRRMKLTTEDNWNIVGCCGDQISDCAGGFAGYIMKLPNYCYFLP